MQRLERERNQHSLNTVYPCTLYAGYYTINHSVTVKELDINLNMDKGYKDNVQDEEFWIHLQSSSIAMVTDTS